MEHAVLSVQEAMDAGYYNHGRGLKAAPSFLRAVRLGRRAVDPALVAEVTAPRTTRGKVLEKGYGGLMHRFLSDGACALAVDTDPWHHRQGLFHLRKAVATGAATLMRDRILFERQLDCAAALGASCITLPAHLLEPHRLRALTEYAHLSEREVMVECTTLTEYQAALSCGADLVGILNRDPVSGTVEPDRARSIRWTAGGDLPLLSIGEYETREDLSRLRGVAHAVVVGRPLVEGRVTVAELLDAG